MSYFEQVKTYFDSIPRKNIGFFPTPLHRLERLSEELEVNLYLKRDDLTGISLFGGNKVRKLEYLMGDAIEKGCDTVFTFGATQSNHAMQTVTACRKFGLTPILYLVAVVEPDEEDLRANMLLDKVLGAEIHIISGNGMTEQEAGKLAVKQADEHKRRLEAQGHMCYMVPTGGASPVGSSGFARGFVELADQMETMGEHADYIFHSTGTGGTLAGLAAGRRLIDSGTSIISIGVSEKQPTHCETVAKLANQTLEYLGSGKRVEAGELHLDQGYFAPGYERPNEGSTEAIKLLARREGILLDPVYTGKGFAGMLDYIRTQKVPKGSTVVFWHTGGATALFAEREIVGNIFE